MTAPQVARVLVGVDFDEASAAALRTAAALGRGWGAALTVFHAASDDVPAYFTAAQIAQLEAEREQTRAAIAAQVRAFAAQHVHGDVTVVVGAGPAQEAIARLAPEFDLVVLGTHRRHGLSRWWLGSVAEAIVLHSPRPVLVVPDGAVIGDRPTVLAAGFETAADAWAGALSSAIGGTVVRAPAIGQCAPDRLEQANVIVLAVPASPARARLDELAHVLKECRHPVLFVPSGEALERSPS